jgi:hypothetical protein
MENLINQDQTSTCKEHSDSERKYSLNSYDAIDGSKSQTEFQKRMEENKSLMLLNNNVSKTCQNSELIFHEDIGFIESQVQNNFSTQVSKSTNKIRNLISFAGLLVLFGMLIALITFLRWQIYIAK